MAEKYEEIVISASERIEELLRSNALLRQQNAELLAALEKIDNFHASHINPPGGNVALDYYDELAQIARTVIKNANIAQGA